MLTSDHAHGDLAFLTWKPDEPNRPADEAAAEAYRAITDHLEAHPAVVLHERVFAEIRAEAAVRSARRTALTDRTSAFAVEPTYVEGRPGRGRGLAGIHLLAVPASRQGGPPRRVVWHEQTCGVEVRGRDASYLALSDVTRFLPVEARHAPAKETAAALALVEQILTAEAWTFNDVRRTWFYLDDILDWYDEFNAVRNAAFSRLGLLGGVAQTPIPASTGILGRSSRQGWCVLDVLAARPLADRPWGIDRLANPGQNEAPEYGSAFSRALRMSLASCDYVFVSGTAAIDEHGRSVHPGDFTAQLELTLTMVRSLLEQANATFENICQGTAFVKRPEDVPVFERVARQAGLEAVCTLADVCRPELLFELDATAVVPRPV